MLVIFAVLAMTLAEGADEDVMHAFEEVMGQSSQCKNTCVQTYPLHTYDVPSNLEACDRGCRLFSICEWAEDDDNFNNTLTSCGNACAEAYSADQELLSCKLGCKSALLPAKERKTKLEKEDPHTRLVIGDPFSSPSHLFFSSLKMEPVDDMFSQISRHPFLKAADDHMKNMLDIAFHLLNSRSPLTSLGDKDSEEIVIISFQSPEINTQHPLGKQAILNTDGNNLHAKTTFDHIESNLQTNLYGRSFIDSIYEEDKDDEWAEFYDDIDHYNNPAVRDRLKDWWNCFTRKAGLPELVLLVFWISTMMLLLMCCAIQFPPKSANKKLSIKGDLAYIRESKGRIPDFLRVYGHPEVVRFTEVKQYKPDEKMPLIAYS